MILKEKKDKQLVTTKTKKAIVFNMTMATFLGRQNLFLNGAIAFCPKTKFGLCNLFFFKELGETIFIYCFAQLKVSRRRRIAG